jgi:hypothetical protein
LSSTSLEYKHNSWYQDDYSSVNCMDFFQYISNPCCKCVLNSIIKRVRNLNRVSDALNVDSFLINDYVEGKYQIPYELTKKIINLGYEVCPFETIEFLNQDLDTHEFLFNCYATGSKPKKTAKSIKAKTNYVAQGGERLKDVKDGLYEYISRLCRLRLIQVAFNALNKERKKNRKKKIKNGIGFTREDLKSAATILGNEIGVAGCTIRRWMSYQTDQNGEVQPNIQSCNANAEKLVNVALKYAKEEAIEILEADFAEHRFQLDERLNYVAQGGERHNGGSGF